MTTFPLTDDYVKIAFPTRKELRALFAKPSVAIAAMICGTLIVLSMIGSVVWLAMNGKDSAVIGALVTVTLAAVGTLLSVRIKRIEEATKKTEP